MRRLFQQWDGVLLAAVAAGLGTLAVAAGLLLGGAGLLSLAAVAATALLWAGLLGGAVYGRRRRAQQQWWQTNQDLADLTNRTKSLFEFLARQFNGQFSNIKTENDQVRTLLADAIDKLINSFTGLEQQTRRQQELALGLAGKGGGAQGGLSFETFLKEIDEVLATFTDAIGRNSEMARGMVQSMGETSRQFQTVLGLLGEVKKIADQTNLLAINAAVEAARAGQAGKGFAVVAEEVRNLSIRSNRFSDQIGTSVEGISQALADAEKIVNQMASQDQVVTGGARRRVDALMEKTREFNASVEASGREISDSSERVAGEVRHAVTSLQFQDMATQVLGTVNNRVENLESLLESLAVLSLEERRGAGQDLSEECRGRLEDFKQAIEEAGRLLEKASHNPVSQKSMDEGDIELF
ncbi:methyl-accepting chemotaxis protein [Geoalkalibacter halelectricus]|uniref:methyl-accepting chemotaxis protein n=1 Tax=Geoalkalibacter halelectricus TaxID=2847045 RepID=UPI003D24B81A